jgi:hypothetical protein
MTRRTQFYGLVGFGVTRAILSYVGYIFFETAILGVSSLEGVVVVP